MNLKYAVISLAALCFLSQFSGAAQAPIRRMALTFDDLPYSSNVREGWLANAKRGTTQILAVLKKHRAPAVAFVVEASLQQDPQGRTALLQQWLDAGMTLGNHSFSHPDFNGVTVERFQEEILRGEVVTRRLMAEQK